jgi:flagellar L-ring protein precursor FlgH
LPAKLGDAISAIVREVKPNGTMLVEARKTIARDNEISELVLSGLVREEDITQQNTILSSQMADLRIILENQGDLKKAAEKGLITRVLDTVFAF